MSEEVVTFVELDVERCTRDFGVLPCHASLTGYVDDEAFGSDLINNNVAGWTAADVTLTAGADGATVEPTTTFGYIHRNATEFEGRRYRYVTVDVETVANISGGTGVILYKTDDHGYSNLYYKTFTLPAVGERERVIIDMSTLTVGSDAWLTSDITGIAAGFTAVDASCEFIVRSVRVGLFKNNFGKKCFKTIGTCQDRQSFDTVIETLRFTMRDQTGIPLSYDALPYIRSVAHNPGAIAPGESMGERSGVTITFSDARHNDTGPAGDPYRDERGIDALTTGTFFGRFRTRYRYIQSRPLRVYRGRMGQLLSEMEVWHYVVDAFTGPSANGSFTIVAKDILKLADSDKAQAPVPSRGSSAGALTTTTTTVTLTPAGIGDEDYPASGIASIGGRECVSFTRSGDTMTITRAQLNTEAQAHAAGARVQLVLQYMAENPADVIYDLLTEYAGIDPAFIDLDAWLTETTGFLGTLYTANITEPTGVRALVNELVQQAALVMWWDAKASLIRLQVLRKITSDVQTFDESNILKGTFGVTEQPNKRLSQVMIYYDVRNPCLRLDESNFRSSALVGAFQHESDYGSAAIRKIFSRWIPNGGRSAALRVASTLLARFKIPPRQLTFSAFKAADDVQLGAGYQVKAWALQTDEGLPESVPAQVTRLLVDDAKYQVTAEEVLFDYEDAGGGSLEDRIIILEATQLDANLLSIHNALYPPITDVGDITLKVIIENGVIIGSSSTSTPALRIEGFPSGLPITLVIRGRIQGAGGRGGIGQTNTGGGPSNGLPGGPALYVRNAVKVLMNDGPVGQIYGGGGGGGAGYPINFRWGVGGGGGGAGLVGGSGGAGRSGNEGAGEGGTAGTSEAGGGGGNPFNYTAPGGAGGGPGLAGSPAGVSGGPGGAAGRSIDGVSYLTFDDGRGDIRGPEAN